MNGVIIMLIRLFVVVIFGYIGYQYSTFCFENNFDFLDVIKNTISQICIPLYISVLIHELGHCFVCRIEKVKIKLISAIGICIYSDENKIRVKFNANGIVGAGRVIPIFDRMNCESEVQISIKKLSNICLGGVVFTMIIFMISFITYLAGIHSLFLQNMYLLNSVILVNSFISNKRYVGDLYLFFNKLNLEKEIKTMLFANSVINNNISNYLYQYIIEDINKSNDIDNNKLLLINQMLQYNIVNKINAVDQRELCMYAINNKRDLMNNKELDKVQVFIYLFNVIDYLVNIEENYEEAILIYNKMKEDESTFNTMKYSWLKYYIIRTKKSFQYNNYSEKKLKKYERIANEKWGLGL